MYFCDADSYVGEATLPAIYNQAFAAVDTANSGETSVSALSRVLGTSSLSASTIDKVYPAQLLFVWF